MSRGRAGSLLGLLVALLLLGLSAPADAAVRGRIVGVEAKNGQLRVVFSAVGLAEAEQINPGTVTLSLDGESLKPAVEAAAAAPSTSVVRRAMLAIDTSGSMTINNRIGAARQAALAYLASVPSDVEVGLVTFSSTAVLRVAPTKDRAVVRRAVQGLRASGNTALYDAVSRAVTVLGRSGERSILVLSDGKDEGSHTRLSQNINSLRTYKVALNAVLLGDTSAEQALVSLSNAAGGRVVSARAAPDLTRAFEQQARASDKDIVVTAEIPARFTGGEAPVTVSAAAAGQKVSDTALAVNLLSRAALARDDLATYGARPASPIHGPFSHKPVMYAGLLGLLVGIGTLLAFALNGVAVRPESMSGRLSPFVDTAAPRRQVKESRNLRQTAVGIADEIVKRRGLEEVLSRKLEAGGVPLKPAEWLILHIGIALVFPLMVLLLTSVNIALTVVAVVVGVLGPLAYLAVKATLRTRRFLAQLPDTLQLLAGSLSSGYSLPQAIDAVVRQGNAPIADELRKALVEARLGAPVEDALDDVADRMASKDFHWVVMAVRIQRQVGGNLAEVLATTAATLRERERLRRQVQVLSAEGRLSAYVLFGLPCVFSLYLLATRPDYLKPLVTDPIGWIMLVGMGVFLVVGGFWLRKVVQVEV